MCCVWIISLCLCFGRLLYPPSRVLNQMQNNYFSDPLGSNWFPLMSLSMLACIFSGKPFWCGGCVSLPFLGRCLNCQSTVWADLCWVAQRWYFLVGAKTMSGAAKWEVDQIFFMSSSLAFFHFSDYGNSYKAPVWIGLSWILQFILVQTHHGWIGMW